jgi:hypothetical protein
VIAAEDSHVVRAFLSRTLEQAPGFELVTVCSDRMELDRAIASAWTDVVVSDIRMPPLGEDEGIPRREPVARVTSGCRGSWRSVSTPIQRRRRRCLWSGRAAAGGSVIDQKIVDVAVRG